MTAAAAEGPHEAEPLFDATGFLDGAHDVTKPRSRWLDAYYALKPFIPRRVQLAVRRRHGRRRSTRGFPAWPVEDSLVRLQEELFRAEMERRGADRIPFLNFWPDSKRFGFVLTHDVEGPVGLSNVARVLEVERRHGLVSAWYFVAEDYEIPLGTFELIRAAGGEVGLHGLTHRGDSLPRPGQLRVAAARHPPLHARVGGGGLSLARHPPQGRVDARARLSL
ncbi:hypothetical protein KRR39_07335 [Nocardioides panacis]|uniref:NodB homology domain-containing protein n=1 Tax=Nocardioides panacis TaxID=2849501 RepID=A0A975T0Y3_9ACTN|nr:hypothetical protein [Nocardioides panacis]QWZ09557.1 hypothetical protein KRR39_07335 [Nocardioides panacis]